MTHNNYAELLRSPQWQKKRLEIMQRDNFTCQSCGSTQKTLTVHHKYYTNGCAPWDYPDECYITLCEDCHENEHGLAPTPKIGKFYTYSHSDYDNYMLCFDIDKNNNIVYLFGIDSGAGDAAWINAMPLSEFKQKVFVFDMFMDGETECMEQYFLYAYKNLLVNRNVYVDGLMKMTNEQLIRLAKQKVTKILTDKNIRTDEI